MTDAGAYEHQRAVPVGEAAHHARAPADLPVQPLDHVVRADPPAVPVRELVQQVGRRLADALAQAVRGGLEPPGFHLHGDLFGLGQGGFPGFHGEYGLQGRRRPFAVAGRRLREHVAHETRHAPLAPRLRQHRADRGDESGAPVADHEPDALQTAFDHRGRERGALQFRHLEPEPAGLGGQAPLVVAGPVGVGLPSAGTLVSGHPTISSA